MDPAVRAQVTDFDLPRPLARLVGRIWDHADRGSLDGGWFSNLVDSSHYSVVEEAEEAEEGGLEEGDSDDDDDSGDDSDGEEEEEDLEGYSEAAGSRVDDEGKEVDGKCRPAPLLTNPTPLALPCLALPWQLLSGGNTTF